MRIDRSDPADGPSDVRMASRVRSTTDNPDVSAKDKGTVLDADGSPGSSPTQLDSVLRTERAMAYRAVVDAAYRQYATERGDARAETLERGTASSAVNCTDVDDSDRYLVGLTGGLRRAGQNAEYSGKSPQTRDGTSAGTGDGTAYAFGDQPVTASGGDGSIGNRGGTRPPADDIPPDPEGEDPEGLNGGLGELVRVNAKDRAAGLLAERIDGEASVRFANGPANEFDALSAEYVAQAKPANFTLNKAFRDQAKVTFEVALQSGRIPYFQFDGPPGPGVLQALSRYADRYGIEPMVDLTPLRRS